MAITPPTTKIEIISQAAILVGRQSFNSLDAGGAFARDGDALFNTLVSAELGSNRWRFAQDFQEMSNLNTLTPNFDGWEFFWEKPADLLMLQYIDPFVDYIEFGNRILTRTDQTLTAVFSKNVPVSQWPGPFSIYIVYQLASMLGISVTNSDQTLLRITKDKELWQSRALFADGQSSRPGKIRANPYVNVRYQFRTRRGR